MIILPCFIFISFTVLQMKQNKELFALYFIINLDSRFRIKIVLRLAMRRTEKNDYMKMRPLLSRTKMITID